MLPTEDRKIATIDKSSTNLIEDEQPAMNCEMENRRIEKKIIYYIEILKMYIDSF